MRPVVMNAVAIAVAVASAAVLVGSITLVISGPGSPSTILAAASSETIPPFQSVPPSSHLVCGQVRCGSPGEQWIQFSVQYHARLSGSMHAEPAFEVWIGNAPGMGAACVLSNPPPPCAQAIGEPYLYKTPAALTSIDFGQIEFDFAGNGDALPPGSWTILMINWSDSPVVLTVDSGVTVTPTW